MNLTIQTSSRPEIFVGIDVDAKSYAVTYQDRNKEGKSFKMPASAQQLHYYFQKRFPEKRIIYTYEAGGTGYSLHDYLANQNQVCMMVHPGNVKKAPKDRVKTNRIDSQKLSDQLHSGELKAIRVPSENYRYLRQLVDMRQQHVHASTQAKQRIKALLLYENISLPEDMKSWSRSFLKMLRELASTLKPVPQLKLTALLDELDHQRERVVWSSKQLLAFCQANEEIQRNVGYLKSIPGFGFVISTYILARIGDPCNLRKLNELGSFAGVVPAEYSTGEEINRGNITHMGDPLLRSLLIEASWVAIHKDTELNQFYNRIKAKHPLKHGSRIAIVAVARKLTQRVYKVLKEQRDYIVH
jgi:transposase